jgi:hypothetical protein
MFWKPEHLKKMKKRKEGPQEGSRATEVLLFLDGKPEKFPVKYKRTSSSWV